jgi:hypothetical protein
VRRTGPNNTRRLLEALRPLRDLGFTEAEIIKMGFGRFPLGGLAHYSDDWLAFRRGPPVHLHEGTDIFAAFGVPVRAPADGTVRLSSGGLGGISTYVTEPNGTYYYMAHLRGYPKGLQSGARVRVGDIVGFNGDSGNAKGGSPHVHFEYHPRGGGPVNPKPLLDDWLTEALANAPNLIFEFEFRRPRVLISTGLTRTLPDVGDGGTVGATGPSRSQLLWAASANPGGGSLRLAEAEAMAVVSQIDWSELAREAEERADALRQADARARAVLAPLTSPLLHAFLELSMEHQHSEE